MKKTAQVLLIFIIFCLLLWASILFFKNQKILFTKNNSKKSLVAQLLLLPDHSQKKFALNDKIFSFEIVNSDASRIQGLSGRDEIGADGMLFIFPRPGYHAIWMKKMRFALDLIWFDQDGRVIDLDHNVLPPDEKESTSANAGILPVYKPKQPAGMVLEVPAGFINGQAISLNNQIELINSK
jgi:uncharacterized membrane protein (UPF0127 family)